MSFTGVPHRRDCNSPQQPPNTKYSHVHAPFPRTVQVISKPAAWWEKPFHNIKHHTTENNLLDGTSTSPFPLHVQVNEAWKKTKTIQAVNQPAQQALASSPNSSVQLVANMMCVRVSSSVFLTKKTSWKLLEGTPPSLPWPPHGEQHPLRYRTPHRSLRHENNCQL